MHFGRRIVVSIWFGITAITIWTLICFFRRVWHDYGGQSGDEPQTRRMAKKLMMITYAVTASTCLVNIAYYIDSQI